MVNIRYCWDTPSSELNGVQVTVGAFRNTTSYLKLNVFGTLNGSCSSFTPKEDEFIQTMQLMYTPQRISAIVLRTNLLNTVMMGAKPT